MKLKTLFIEILILLVLVVVVVLLYTNMKNKIKDQELELKVYSDSLLLTRGENGELIATIDVLQSERISTLLEIKSKDKVIQKLQEKVKEYEKKMKPGSSVTVGGTTTNVSGTVPISYVDTSEVDTSQTVNKPVSFTFSDEWIDLSGNIKNDSLRFNLKVRNEFSLALINEKKSSYIELREMNPYTDVDYLRTYQVLQKPPSRFGISVQAGYGVTKEVLSPYLGVGVSYTILRL